MVSLTHVLRMALKGMYQHIVLLVLLGFLSVMVLSPSFVLPIHIAVMYLICFIGPLQMAMVKSVQQAIEGEKVDIKTFFLAMKEYFFRGLGFSLILSLFLFIVIASWWYWGQMGTYPSFILACFQTYFVSMILVSQMYTVPLLVKYKYSLKQSMLISLKLLLKNPLYTLGAFAQLVSLALLLGLTVVGFLFLFPGAYTILTHQMTANVVSRYDPTNDSQLTLSKEVKQV